MLGSSMPRRPAVLPIPPGPPFWVVSAPLPVAGLPRAVEGHCAVVERTRDLSLAGIEDADNVFDDGPLAGRLEAWIWEGPPTALQVVLTPAGRARVRITLRAARPGGSAADARRAGRALADELGHVLGRFGGPGWEPSAGVTPMGLGARVLFDPERGFPRGKEQAPRVAELWSLISRHPPGRAAVVLAFAPDPDIPAARRPDAALMDLGFGPAIRAFVRDRACIAVLGAAADDALLLATTRQVLTANRPDLRWRLAADPAALPAAAEHFILGRTLPTVRVGWPDARAFFSLFRQPEARGAVTSDDIPF